MATPHSADETEVLDMALRGNVIAFPQIARRSDGGRGKARAAEILFFTGVRYERQAVVPAPKRKQGRRDQGPRRQA